MSADCNAGMGHGPPAELIEPQEHGEHEEKADDTRACHRVEFKDSPPERSTVMKWQDHVTIDPEICRGRPCIKGTRVMFLLMPQETT